MSFTSSATDPDGSIVSYLWDFGDGTTSTEENPTHVFPQDSTYQIRLSAINELCEDSKTINLPVVHPYVPNIITPNGDNKNDYFVFKSQAPFKLIIVNRWGKEVFSSEEYQNDWDAQGLASGTYFYSIMSKDGKECKGWVEVLR